MIQRAESSPVGRGKRDAALMACLFYSGLRAGEAIALRVEDVTIYPDGNGTLHIRRSKTDQGGVGATVALPADGVRRVVEWLMVSGIESGPLFRGVRSRWDGTPILLKRKTPLNVWIVAYIIKQWAQACGFQEVTSHSLRRSFAQHLTRTGCTIQEVALAGRWSDLKMVLRYCENETASQSVVISAFDQNRRSKFRRLKAV